MKLTARQIQPTLISISWFSLPSNVLNLQRHQNINLTQNFCLFLFFYIKHENKKDQTSVIACSLLFLLPINYLLSMVFHLLFILHYVSHVCVYYTLVIISPPSQRRTTRFFALYMKDYYSRVSSSFGE